METIRFTLVIPIELNDWLKEQATKHNRSRHGEVVNILELAKKRDEVAGNSQDEKWLSIKGGK